MNSAALPDGWMRQMFDSVPRSYNRLNRIMTFGQDEVWRRKALEAVEAKDGDRIVDICTGTGDLALKIACKFPRAEVHAVDYSHEMLVVAKERALEQGLRNIIFEEADCLNMAFPDNYFDYVTISFGFRNLSYSMADFDMRLKKIRRLLKDSGRLIIVETSQPVNIFVKKLFHFYAKKIVPSIGALFSGRREPYAYLGASIVKFFDKDQLIQILEDRGFRMERIESLIFDMISLSIFQKKLPQKA